MGPKIGPIANCYVVRRRRGIGGDHDYSRAGTARTGSGGSRLGPIVGARRALNFEGLTHGWFYESRAALMAAAAPAITVNVSESDTSRWLSQYSGNRTPVGSTKAAR